MCHPYFLAATISLIFINCDVMYLASWHHWSSFKMINPTQVTGVISLSDILNFLVLRPGGDDPSQPGCTDMFSKVNILILMDMTMEDLFSEEAAALFSVTLISRYYNNISIFAQD